MIYQMQSTSIIDKIFGLLNEGGPVFMYVSFFLLLYIVFLFIVAFYKKLYIEKQIRLLKSISLFALVWGFLGQVIGLIGAFDAIETYGNIAPDVLASGIKVSILSPAFGMFIFLIARVEIIVLIYFTKKTE